MSLHERIDADIKAAMLAREKDRLNVLRAIKSAILDYKQKQATSRAAKAAPAKDAGLSLGK